MVNVLQRYQTLLHLLDFNFDWIDDLLSILESVTNDVFPRNKWAHEFNTLGQ